MTILLFLLIVIGLPLGMLKYLGHRATTPVTVEIGGLTVEQLAGIGTKASVSALKRMLGTPRAQPSPDGGLEWSSGNRNGRMSYWIEPLNGGTFRVHAVATSMRIAQHGGVANPETDYGRAKILTNWIFFMLGIPNNPRQLLRQRRRVLRAITRAGTKAAPAAATA